MRILITGGRGGMAYLTASKLSKSGHIVYLCTHTNEQLKSLKKKIGNEDSNILPYKLDITNKQDLELLDQLDYDIVWAHAGIGNGGTLLVMDVDVLRDNYKTNVFGTMEVIKKAYLNFKQKNKKGKIFVTSSLAGMIPFAYLSCYTSSKAALSMLCFTLKKELKDSDTNITISLIEPGAYKTGFNEVMIDNKEKFLDEKDIFYYNRKKITKSQKNIFDIIEKKNTEKLVNKIIKEMLKDRPKFKIRKPFLQVFFTKLYLLFLR